MNLVVYRKGDCPWAAEVMDFLDAEKIPFDDRDVTRNPKFAREVAEKSGRYKSPTLDIDGEILADTDIEEVAAYLKLIGYQLHAA